MRFSGVLKNKVVKNAGWIIVGRAMHMVIAFVVNILTARCLGPSNYGLINYAMAYTTFFASLCTLGINSIIVKDFVDHPDEEGMTIGTALLLRFLSSIFSVIMIMGIVSIIDRDEKITLLVVGLCSLGLVFQIFDTFNYWYQAHLISKYSAMATTIAYIVVSVYKVFLLMTGKSVTWFALSTSIDYLVTAFFLVLFYFKTGGPKISFSRKKVGSLLSKSYHFILAGVMVSVYSATDKLMIKHLVGEDAVGYYATAVSLCNTWTFILVAIIDSVTPVILESAKVDNNKYLQLNKRLYCMVIYISVAVSLGIVLFAGPIINILYGEAYLPTVAPLRIIIWYIAFSYLGVARNAWMVTENKQKYLVYIYISAALLNVVLNMVFIPQYGISGAAFASLVTQISTILIFPAIIKPLRPNVVLMLQSFLFKIK